MKEQNSVFGDISEYTITKRNDDFIQYAFFNAEDDLVLSIPAKSVRVFEAGGNADIVLLGPQFRVQLDSVKGAVQCPVEVIDMMAYGMMDGKKVIEQVRKTLSANSCRPSAYANLYGEPRPAWCCA